LSPALFRLEPALPVVINHTKSERTIGFEKTRISLPQGATKVDPEVVEYMRSNDYLMAVIAAGDLEIRDDVLAPGSRTLGDVLPRSLEGLKIADVRKAIAACEDPKRLEMWLSAHDGDPKVRKMLQDRYFVLVPDLENEPKEGPL
jgi:hypothetical protein